GPLDMRMGGEEPSAAEVVAQASERELADVIYTLGEERHARPVARAIVAARQRGPIETTAALASIVAGAVRGKPGAIHPATRTFQALRIRDYNVTAEGTIDHPILEPSQTQNIHWAVHNFDASEYRDEYREELLALLLEKSEIPRYHDLDRMQSYISAKGDPDKAWKIFYLYAMGEKPGANRARCPRTSA
ncbi:MAG: 16S rRNA (cytosine(1402)-N(4))-methyltransferase, partial [Chthoniobacterales bacterium]